MLEFFRSYTCIAFSYTHLDVYKRQASGLLQEEVVKRTVFHFYMYKQEELIRQMIGNIYTECKGFEKQQESV